MVDDATGNPEPPGTSPRAAQEQAPHLSAWELEPMQAGPRAPPEVPGSSLVGSAGRRLVHDPRQLARQVGPGVVVQGEIRVALVDVVERQEPAGRGVAK